MAIRGNISAASLVDVLQLLALGNKTGRLSIAGSGSFGVIQFVHGCVVHAGLVNPRHYLGDRLVRAGAIAVNDRARLAAHTRPQDDHELARALLASKRVERATLLQVYRTQMEEAVYHLLGWSQGTFVFEPDNDLAFDTPLVSISTDVLLLEGARRADEWSMIEKRVPSFDLIFEVDPRRANARETALSHTQQRMLPMLDGTHDVHALIECSGLGEFDVGKALYGLIAAGFVQCVGRSAPRRPPPESRAAAHQNLGVAFYRAGMLEEAFCEFRRVLELRADDGLALFHLGLIHARRGEWWEAADTLTRVARGPDAPAAVHHNLAYVREQLGDRPGAVRALDAAQQRAGGGDPRFALSRAFLCLADKDLPQAEAHLATARRLWGARPPSAAWFHAAGLTAALGGDAARAAALLEEGVARHPRAVALHNNLAVVQERLGQYELAVRTLEQALLEEANCAHLHKNLGDCFHRAHRDGEAFDAFMRVVRLAPTHGPDVHLKIGDIHYRRGAFDRARQAWEHALRLDPDHRVVQANLAGLPTHFEHVVDHDLDPLAMFGVEG